MNLFSAARLLKLSASTATRSSVPAAERHSGSVDDSTLVGNQFDHHSGRIGRVLDGVFEADGGADDADPDDDDGWHDLGPEDADKKER